jgi:hypothetical protein
VTNQGKNANLMQGQKRINLHDGEVVTEQNECGHVNNILWTTPQVREQLGGTRSRQPDKITREDVPAVSCKYHSEMANFYRHVPPRQMVTAFTHRLRALPREDGNETWAGKERQRIE